MNLFRHRRRIRQSGRDLLRRTIAFRAARPARIAGDVYLAPGFIDIQVNGFAGVDYNHPATPHEEIARSLGALFATA